MKINKKINKKRIKMDYWSIMEIRGLDQTKIKFNRRKYYYNQINRKNHYYLNHK